MSAPDPLRHVFDDEPGLRRRRAGRGFFYLDSRNRPVDAATRARIERLAIPPAWKEVWICPHPQGHIQATGRDARGRKQYIYHPAWREWRAQGKFSRIIDFAAALPRLRGQVALDLGERKLSRTLVVATAVRVLDRTLMRVGNEEYARQNQSFGLTTLRDEHVARVGSKVRFSFRGKHGKPFVAEVSDRRVAAILRRLEGLPGQHLFQFVDDGEPHRITSDDVNAYIRDATRADFSAKDFRTWAATVLAVVELAKLVPEEGARAKAKNLARAIREVSARLGNTPAVCRASYVHPHILSSYLDGTLPLAASLAEALADGDGEGLLSAERSVLRLLRRRLGELEGTTEPDGKAVPAAALALAPAA
jgi:DNA topoisomerase-1